MKYEIGDFVVCEKTGREGVVFDYGWINPNSVRIGSMFDALLVKLGDLQLEIWNCDNVKKINNKDISVC